MSAADAAASVLGARAQRDVPVGPRTTYRVGGAAALFVEAASRDDLEAVGAAVRASGLPVLVVGNGSNLLVADAGFPGVAVSLAGEFADLDIDDTTVTAGGAVKLAVLARRTAAAGLTGMEWAVGVPGTVGGAVRMNAGGHGSDIAATCTGATLFDAGVGEWLTLTPAELDFAYRSSSVSPSQIVTSATFALRTGDRAAAEAEIDEIVRWRREHQPGGQNAGSVFTNPAGDSAGRLIEAAGLKGHRIGSAEVSTKHANFIQADPGGRADDVRALIRHVQRAVEEATGVALHPELRLIGFDDA